MPRGRRLDQRTQAHILNAARIIVKERDQVTPVHTVAYPSCLHFIRSQVAPLTGITTCGACGSPFGGATFALNICLYVIYLSICALNNRSHGDRSGHLTGGLIGIKTRGHPVRHHRRARLSPVFLLEKACLPRCLRDSLFFPLGRPADDSHREYPFIYDTAADLSAVADYLISRADVDGARLGVTGISLGGMTAWYAAAADTR